jgi:hypothetical protein
MNAIFLTGITGLETKVEQRFGPQTAAIVNDNGAVFGEIFKALLESVGVMYDPRTTMLVWVGLDAPHQVKLTCGEDFAATLKRRGQPGFDAVKAIANVLRALYHLQQHQKIKLAEIRT